MKIVNDFIVIEADDVAGLSELKLLSLAHAVSSSISPEAYLNIVLDSAINSAVDGFKNSKSMVFDPVVQAIISVEDNLKKASVQKLLDQINGILGFPKVSIP